MNTYFAGKFKGLMILNLSAAAVALNELLLKALFSFLLSSEEKLISKVSTVVQDC